MISMPEIPLFGLITKEGRQRKQFTRLRDDVHLQTGLQYRERMRANPEPTAEEAAIGVLREELEPQVREAVFEFNRKGYKTVSSGFDGIHTERQIMEGNFLLDAETREKFVAMGVVVTTEPWWKWEQKVRMGIADPHAPAEEKILTAIRFRAAQPDLQTIEAQWKQIAELLPDRRQSAPG